MIYFRRALVAPPALEPMGGLFSYPLGKTKAAIHGRSQPPMGQCEKFTMGIVLV
jgi:hypothetical protein